MFRLLLVHHTDECWGSRVFLCGGRDHCREDSSDVQPKCRQKHPEEHDIHVITHIHPSIHTHTHTHIHVHKCSKKPQRQRQLKRLS